MRLVLAIFSFVMTLSSVTQAQVSCPLNAPVTITTPLQVYRSVTVIDEEKSGVTENWIVKTPSGQESLAKASVLKCDLIGIADQPVPVAQPQPQPVSSASLELRLHGSNTVGARLAPEFAKAYAAKNSLTAETETELRSEEKDVEYGAAETARKFTFRFRSHGTATAFQSLLAGAADIGMASRRANEKEIASLSTGGYGDLTAPKTENVIGLDGLVVIVNKENPVDALTLEQIAAIFSGEITNWDKAGGQLGQINVYARDNKSGTFDTFKALVLESGKKRELAASAKRFEGSDQLSDAVAADPSGIGFIGFAYVRNAKPLGILTTCDLKFEADKFSVRTEEYPLSRRLFFYTPVKTRTPEVDRFVQFVLSDEGQTITENMGFIGLNIEQSSKMYALERGQLTRIVGPSTGASAPALMLSFSQRIANAARLSVTFRFKTGSTELDNRSLEDVNRLAAYIRANPGFADRTMLFGFADNVGNFESNRILSRERAVQVADALGAQGIRIPQAQIQGFSAIAPVACSDSENALAKNRRVEVWLRR